MGEFQFQDMLIYHYILSDSVMLEKTKQEYFQNSILRGLFGIAKDYSLKYHDAPSKQELKKIIQDKCLSDEYSNDIIDTIYDNTNLGEYSEEWLRDNSAKWVKIRNIEYVLRKTTAYMKTSNLNSENADEVVEKIKTMIISETAIDFNFAEGSDFFNAESHTTSELVKHSTGYSYLDMSLKGGFYKGGLFVLLAGSKCGKSFWLCNLAAESIKLGYNTVYITLELAEGMVNKRIASNLLDMTMDEYSKKCKDIDFMRDKLTTLKNNSMLPMGELHIKQFPTSTLSAHNLATYIKKLEESRGIKFTNVIIDYINIMQNAKNPNSENMYLKIKTIAEDLRAVGQYNDWTILTVTQTNREGWDNTDLQVKNISESGGLLHTVDGLFGIITNPEMKANGEYYVKSMAMRDGELENTRKKFLIDWTKGRITEDRLSNIEDCSMINQLNNHNNQTKYNNKNNNSNANVTNTTIQNTQQVNDSANATVERVYINNTTFKKNATVGLEFKSELELYDGCEQYSKFSDDEVICLMSTKSKSTLCAVSYSGLSHDNKPKFRIIKFIEKNENKQVATNLDGIFVDNSVLICKQTSEGDKIIGKLTHPMDVNVLDMKMDVEPKISKPLGDANSVFYSADFVNTTPDSIHNLFN